MDSRAATMNELKAAVRWILQHNVGTHLVGALSIAGGFAFSFIHPDQALQGVALATMGAGLMAGAHAFDR